ncbi:sensor histidine kinase [Pseudomarimonas arenosa]|uniref:histidine kinase n=1 Tax=Pseudomarimonas arenosa TaxID=2774145 RepID=A0AAW3ZIN6_9GAMM|nr:HAMP domain-containing sensor histidine kinase [Pseudomarimonas arenosa]MBD8524181.1 HAMP domain-containing histidine kinase [Pseudomarimonas arenosa]
MSTAPPPAAPTLTDQTAPQQRRRLRASAVDRAALRREAYFFTLWRAFQAAVLAFFVFSPAGLEVTELRQPALGRALSVSYLIFAVLIFLPTIRARARLSWLAAVGIVVDILVTATARAVLDGPDIGLSLLLIVNVGACALLLPFRWGIGFAALAGAATTGEFVLTGIYQWSDRGSAIETAMLCVTYLTAAVLCYQLGKQLRDSLALAEQHGARAESLAEVNELVIRRMRSGVAVVDQNMQIRLLNETGWHLLGAPPSGKRDLRAISPVLASRVAEWLGAPKEVEDSTLQLRPDLPSVIPRMTRLGTREELYLIFLDDGSLVSRRAEALTLATLGRLSASIAHEIRNPLAAIQHAAQLLEESTELPAEDRRLIEIMLNHCHRMNGIVENVLALSRRERSRPESIDICEWISNYVTDYRSDHFLDPETLHQGICHANVRAVVDPSQLHQVLGILVSNALKHGHRPGEPARIVIHALADSESGFPTIDVCDSGPGIPEAMRERIFDPFFTTSDVGSGLGLYIAKALCEANQASLEYLPEEGEQPSRFRLTLARAFDS